MREQMTYLASNYCVTCGTENLTFPAIRCRSCIDKRMNLIYTQTFFCAYCGIPCSDLSAKRDYHCESCHQVSENPNFDYSRTYTEAAIPFLEKAIDDKTLPKHVRQSYIRQHSAIMCGVMKLAKTTSTTI
jgi:hypothetical protein